MALKSKMKKLIVQNLSVCNGSGKHHYNFSIILSLGNFAENIYNGNLSLKGAKIRQRDMEDMIKIIQSK